MKNENNKSTFKRYVIPAILSFIAFIAWGCSGKMTPSTISPIANAANTFRHLAARAVSGSHIYKSAGSINAMGFASEAITVPSALQQSFEGRCTFALDTRTLPANSLLPLVLDRGDDQNCSVFFSTPNPAAGSLIIEDGTLGTLVVQADTSTEQNLVCKDLTNTGLTTDGSFVSVWLNATTGQVTLFSGTTQIPTTCSISIPQGDAVTRISAQFLKD